MIYLTFLSFEQLFSYSHLEFAFNKSIKGVRWKPQIQRKIQNKELFIYDLYKSIHNGTYTIDKPFHFEICERGKIRQIEAYKLKDKIVQRVMCDYLLTPLLSKKLIYDSGATIKHKGTLWSKNRCTFYLNKFWNEYKTNNGYCLTIDISKYFENINHNILLNKIQPYILDDKIKKLLKEMIKTNSKGLGLGSQISQICALFYLNDLDHYIKEKLHIKHYCRYMDDMILIHKDKKYLYKCFRKITKKFKQLNLRLNQNKLKIQNLSCGFIYLKTKYILTNKGTIIKKITNNTFKSMKRKLKKVKNMQEIFNSWYSYVSWFNDNKRLMKFINNHNLKQYLEELKISKKKK